MLPRLEPVSFVYSAAAAAAGDSTVNFGDKLHCISDRDCGFRLELIC